MVLPNGWGLEVVRGRDVGRVLPVRPGRCTLGNALNGEDGIDLGGQEGSSPRRMAPRQALLDCSGEKLLLCDLDSPGGTFVNRQRLLADQFRPLQAGDVIQLGSVQLRVVPQAARALGEPAVKTAPPASPSNGGLRTAMVLASGTTCRTWDDFLTVSAQNWGGLREELVSGRLDAFLRSLGRDDLRTPSASSKTPDERLDEWLGRLPATRSSSPELDVHPSVVRVRAVPGGGVVRTKVTITNTGYRLLRSTVRVEPPGTGWLKVAKAFSAGPFLTTESTDVPLEVEIPETLEGPRTCTLAVESNGGNQRVEVRVEAAVRPEGVDGPPVGTTSQSAPELFAAVAKLPASTRVFGAVALACLTRLLVAVGDRLTGFLGLTATSAPSLPGVVLLTAAVGCFLGLRFAQSRGGGRDLVPAGFTGAFAGLLFGTLAVATCRSIEPPAGEGGGVPLLLGFGLWAVFGALVAAGSLGVIPYRRAEMKGGAA